MRKASRIIIEFVAGFFLYMTCLTAFASGPALTPRLAMLLVFIAPGAIALACGLALARFDHWRRDTGIVLVSASALTLWVIITVASVFPTRPFRQMARPDSIQFIGEYHYIAASVVMIILGALGVALIGIDKSKTRHRRNEKEAATI